MCQYLNGKTQVQEHVRVYITICTYRLHSHNDIKLLWLVLANKSKWRLFTHFNCDVHVVPPHSSALIESYAHTQTHTNAHLTTNTTNTRRVSPPAQMGDFSDYHLSVITPLDSCCGGDHRSTDTWMDIWTHRLRRTVQQIPG